MENYNNIVKRLFRSSWLCSITKDCLSLIKEIPTEINLSTLEQVNTGHIYSEDQVARVEDNPNAIGIIEMLYNSPRVTVDMGKEGNKHLIRADKVYISTSDIAEIIYLGGTLTIINPLDTVQIHSDLNTYLTEVTNNVTYSPHYKPPPAQDLEAFNRLYNLLESLANNYRDRGLGNTALSRLFNITTKTATGDKGYSTTLDGSRRVATVGLITPKKGNPYDIR